jgi:hypothetical protein
LKSENIWKIWRKSKWNSEKIWKIWKKGKLNSEMILKIWKISVLVIFTPKETSSSSLPLPPPPAAETAAIYTYHNVEIQPKIRYKQKQNETHYENITH